eukprot:COSAG05_NODE_341_length_11060_cov_29.709424_9_plen_212_part_00
MRSSSKGWQYEAQQRLTTDDPSDARAEVVPSINSDGQKCSRIGGSVFQVYRGVILSLLCPPVNAFSQASGMNSFGDAGPSLGGANSRIFTVLTVYSLMNGATLHVIPQLFHESGLLVGAYCAPQTPTGPVCAARTAYNVAGVGVTAAVGAVSCYTCGLIVQIGAYSTEYHDFSDWYDPALAPATMCPSLPVPISVWLYSSRMRAGGGWWGK